MRTVANPPNPIGFAMGFLVGSQVDTAIRKALPGWAVVLDETAPKNLDGAYLTRMRNMVGVPSGTPIGIMGWSNGCLNGVRTILLGNLLGKNLQFIHVADGTHADVPPEQSPHKIQVWADCITRARAGEITFTVTASSMLYTKDIRPGLPGRAWPTSWVLDRAMGNPDGTLQVGSPIVDGRFYAEKFASPDYPSTKSEWDLAGERHREQVNVHLPATLSRFWRFGETSPAKIDFRTDTASAVVNAAQRWLNAAPQEDKGHNRGTAIDAWLLACGVPVGNPYCAAFMSRCIRDAFDGLGRPSPVKGSAGARALMAQFKQAGMLVQCRTPGGTALPRSAWEHALVPGNIVFWARPPDPNHGHTACILDRGLDVFFVIEGNADRVWNGPNLYAVCASEKKIDDPLLLGIGVWQ